MIIINMKGGLGNQLFQYAAGRALAVRQEARAGGSVELKLDVTGYGENNGIDTLRRYALGPFNIKASIANAGEIRHLKYPYGIVSKGWRFFKAKILRQFNVRFVPALFNARGPLYLDGFFQTERYFVDKEKEVREDLRLTEPLSPKAESVSRLMRDSPFEAVSLHVRRGDYVSDAKTNEHHGTCDAEYYAKALEHIVTMIGKDIRVFIFSDDIAWVKENLILPYPSIHVSSPEIKDYEELVLMSLCNHNIIANSSFSWWGAWLNANPDKIVTAPRRWVAKGEKDFADIVPSSWKRI